MWYSYMLINRALVGIYHIHTHRSFSTQLGEERSEKLDLIKIVSAHTQVECCPLASVKRIPWKPRMSSSHEHGAVQVVAGTNYKLFLDVANAANKMEHVEATVYGASF